MKSYKGTWSWGEIRTEGELTGMTVCPTDELDRHDAARTTCSCDPICTPLTGKNHDGGDVLGVLISHNPFCERL